MLVSASETKKMIALLFNRRTVFFICHSSFHSVDIKTTVYVKINPL